ncbi:MAG TPA: DinB family protein [Actinocrinis sp.]|nr:DinB family protein [Actinocrinis sp.]
MTEPAAVPPLATEQHVCESCHFTYTEIAPGDALALLEGFPRRYRAAASALTDADLHRRPDPETWSVLEYLCHVRDVYSVHIDRVTRALAEDNPLVDAMNNDARAERGDYNGQDVAQVLGDLERNAARFAELVETVTPDQWPRLMTRRPSEERTVLWLIRHAAHEGVHHLHDIDRIAAGYAAHGA